MRCATVHTLRTSSLCWRLRTAVPVLRSSVPLTQVHAASNNGSGKMSDQTAASVSHVSPSPATPSPKSAIDFLMIVQHLKNTPRSGWLRFQVENPESIADHMFRMGVMSLMASSIPGVDYNRCVKMALVHDLAEALVGDITPHCNVSKEEKQRLEAEAMDKIKATLGDHTDVAQEIHALWCEYEANASVEAKLVKDFDKLEMIIQAHEYEVSQERTLQEFFDSTAGKFQTPLVQSWVAELATRRRAYREMSVTRVPLPPPPPLPPSLVAMQEEAAAASPPKSPSSPVVRTADGAVVMPSSS